MSKTDAIGTLNKIALRLAGIDFDDLTTCERQITQILVECSFLKVEEGTLVYTPK